MNLGLRAKSALALLACILAVLALASLAGWRAIVAIEKSLGASFARNFTLYNEQRILTPVLRELALSQRLADSEVSRRWLLHENDAKNKALFFAEAKHYQRAFEDHSFFLISNQTGNYYYNDKKTPWSEKPRYALSHQAAKDGWFFKSMRQLKPGPTPDFNINVNYDPKLKRTNIWFNVLVSDGKQSLGLAGTGLDLTTALERFLKTTEPGVTPILINDFGAIQAHPRKDLINYNTVGSKGTSRTIYKLLDATDARAMQSALEVARRDPDTIQLLDVTLGGRSQLLAISYAPELNWFVLTAVDLQAARVVDSKVLLPMVFSGVLLLLLLLAAITFAVNRLLLAPLLRLTESVRQVGQGNYNAPLPPASGDELGELTRAFGDMAGQVRSYTEDLEQKIQERTSELTEVNRQMAIANKNIGDSIQYASLIQNAILPERDLARVLGQDYFVWWKPRDVVGGDFYVFRAGDNGFLVGVVDCAGHGVPGALMTMIAHSTIHVAIDALGMADPAAILNHSSARLRNNLQGSELAGRLATHMDAGLCYVDTASKTVTFAGAKTSLYWSDGQQVEEIKGDRVELGGKREISYQNHVVEMAGRAFYLTTDGVLDQSGGTQGFGFGNKRFADMLARNAGQPFDVQREIFQRELAGYQEGRPQRDDITVIGFGSHKI